jgi:hypothetical protein
MQFNHPSSTKKQTKMNMAPLIAIVAVCMFGLIYLVLHWVREEIKYQREDKQEIEDYDKTMLVARALDQHEKRNYNPLHPYQGLATPVILTQPLVVKRLSSSPPATTTRRTVNLQQQEATITQLKDGMKVLTASLKAQASQIQKLSARLEVSKTAPQMALNDQ